MLGGRREVNIQGLLVARPAAAVILLTKPDWDDRAACSAQTCVMSSLPVKGHAS